MNAKRKALRQALMGMLMVLGGHAAGAAPQTPTASELMDWAERSYPQFFPGTQTNRSLAPYVYRHYPATGNYVGVAGTAVYILGPVAGSNEVPLYMGELASLHLLMRVGWAM